jgi:hypothetical protein
MSSLVVLGIYTKYNTDGDKKGNGSVGFPDWTGLKNPISLRMARWYNIPPRHPQVHAQFRCSKANKAHVSPARTPNPKPGAEPLNSKLNL